MYWTRVLEKEKCRPAIAARREFETDKSSLAAGGKKNGGMTGDRDDGLMGNEWKQTVEMRYI